jgi:hypothetical protein
MQAIIITGSRYADGDIWRKRIRNALAPYDTVPNVPTLIHGACNGADVMAAEIARDFGWQIMPMPANWHICGHQAGRYRNANMVKVGAMLKEQTWDVVVLAFPDADSRGTWDCVNQAKDMGLKVEVIR